MEIRGFFSDESEYYQSLVPESNGVCHVRFRSSRGQALAVLLFTNDKCYKMVPESSNGDFDYFCCDIETGECRTEYFFEINTKGKTYFYGRNGCKSRPESIRKFEILPNFDIPKWARGAVMYQIFPDRFCNGDPSNDVADGEYFYAGKAVKHTDINTHIPETLDVSNFCGGDLQGIIDKLDYLESLGVEIILLNPIFVSPSNHKYDIQDYYHVDPHLGVIVNDAETDREATKADPISFKYKVRTSDEENLSASDMLLVKLISLAHERGMKVILDGVFNHSGSLIKWFDSGHIYSECKNADDGADDNPQSRYREYYDFRDDGSCDFWFGVETLPKLNYENSEALCSEILNIARRWVSPPFCADGWRLDVGADIGHSEDYNHEFWRRFRAAVKEANPDAYIVAEHYEDPTKWLDGTQWDSVMNYRAFMDPMTFFFTGLEKHSDYERKELKGDAAVFKRSLGNMSAEMNYRSLLAAMNQLDNHDHSRFLTRTNGKVGRLAGLGAKAASEGVKQWMLRQAAVFQMTWPGNPCIYYGDEAGVCGFTDPDSRRPYPWGREDRDLLKFYRDLVSLRKKYPVFRNGSTRMIYSQNEVFAYTRFTDKEQAYVVISASDDGQIIELPVWIGGRSYNAKESFTQVLAVTRTGSRFIPVKLESSSGNLSIIVPPHCALIIV